MRSRSRIQQWARRAAAGVGAVVLGNPRSLIAFQGQGGFVPASQLPTETLPSAPLVIAAYTVAWLAVLIYVSMLWRRAGRLEADVADLRARLTRQPAGGR